MATEVGSIYVNVGVNDAQFARGMASVRSQLHSTAKAALLTAGAFVGIRSLTGAIEGSIKAASDLNTQLSRTNLAFGRSSGQVKAWSKTTANSMGIARKDSLAYANSLGIVLQRLGQTQQAAARQSQTLVKRAAAISTVVPGATSQGVEQALEQALTGRVKALRQYGVVITDTMVKEQAQRLGLVKTTVSSQAVAHSQRNVAIAEAELARVRVKHLANSVAVAKAEGRLETAQASLAKAQAGGTSSLTANQKALAVYNAFLQQTLGIQKKADQETGSFHNQMSRLRAEVTDLESGIGQALLPTINKYVTKAANWLAVDKNQATVLADVQSVVTTVKSAIAGLSGAVHSLIGPARTLKDIFGGWKGVLAVLIGFKVAGWMRGIGGAATGATGQVSGLAGAINTLRANAALPIIFTIQMKVIGGLLEKYLPGTGPGDATKGSGGAYPLGKSGGISYFYDTKTGQYYFNPRGGSKPSVPVENPSSIPANIRAKAIGKPGIAPGVGDVIGSLTGGVKAAAPSVADVFGPAAARYRRNHPLSVTPTPTPLVDDGGGGGGGDDTPKWLKAFRNHLARMQLNVDRAGLTTTLKDDVKAERSILGYIREQLKGHKNNLELQQALVQAQGDMLGLKKQELSVEKEARDKAAQARKAALDATRASFGSIFGGPVLSPTSAQVKARLGVRFDAQPGRMLADLRAQTTQGLAFESALTTLRVRGAPTGLLDELRQAGVGELPRIQSLSRQGKGFLKQYFGAYSQLNRANMAAAQISTMSVAKVERLVLAGGSMTGVPPDIEINIYGGNPDAIADKVLKVLQTRARHTLPSTRGRHGGKGHGLG